VLIWAYVLSSVIGFHVIMGKKQQNLVKKSLADYRIKFNAPSVGIRGQLSHLSLDLGVVA
jgi:hypothetical protein